MAKLGELTVTSQGFGAMGLSGRYGSADDSVSIRTVQRAIELGVTLIDTANRYGAGHNEELIGQALSGRRDRVVLATKFGITGQLGEKRGINNDPSHMRSELESSLKRLRVDHIDLYYVHRISPAQPIEEIVGALAREKDAGKIGAIGLSEATAEQLRRAHAVHPITALQSEFSLWTRDVENEILPIAHALGIGFVAFSPLGRGFLAGAEMGDAGDRRHEHPRFQPEALAANTLRREAVTRVAARLGVTIGQVSLAWVMAKQTVPIPGTRHIAHLEENWAANEVTLDGAAMEELERAFPPGTTAGARSPYLTDATPPATAG